MTKIFCDRCGVEGREVNRVHVDFNPGNDFDGDYDNIDLCPACAKDLRTLVTERLPQEAKK